MKTDFSGFKFFYFMTKIQWPIRGRFTLAPGTKLQQRVPCIGSGGGEEQHWKCDPVKHGNPTVTTNQICNKNVNI